MIIYSAMISKLGVEVSLEFKDGTGGDLLLYKHPLTIDSIKSIMKAGKFLAKRKNQLSMMKLH